MSGTDPPGSGTADPPLMRNQLTARYLDHVRRHGLGVDELAGAAQGVFNLAASSYQGRCLSRPVFLSHPEVTRVTEDLAQLYAALSALPGRLFDGDLEAFARAAELAEPQVAAVRQTFRGSPTRLARADLYHDGEFRLLEHNMGSNIGGLDSAMLNQALLTLPVVAEFAAANSLRYVDTMVELVDTLRAECQLPPGRRPLVAAVDWPARYPGLAANLRHSAAALAPLGLDVTPCHLGQLRYTGGRVWLDNRPVEVVYRLFHIEDLVEPGAGELFDPLLRAVEAGAVSLFTPLDAELYGSKAALAMLSDESHRDRFPASELASLDRLLPWTRLVRDQPVTVDGDRVELRRYALDHRDQLILKPTSRHGGSGVVPGWRVEPDQWRRRLDEAIDQPYVIQRRVNAVPEPFPVAGRPGRPRPWLLKWEIFTVRAGFGGASVIGSTDLAGDVVNMSRGGTAGCCFDQAAPGRD
jgi:hypothetical protein